MENSGKVIVIFLLYSAAMFILPIFTFFAVEKILKDEFNITGFPNRAWSLISAVVVVNFLIITYVWRAYKQEVEDEKAEGAATLPKIDLNFKKIKKPRYVRVNTLLRTPDEIIKEFKKEGWTFIPIPDDYSQYLQLISNLEEESFTRDFHIKELLVFPSGVQLYDYEMYRNGSILLQDKASCLPAYLLKPSSNSIVLDMCAAPGMKTTHLSAIMKNKGKLYASEMNTNRYEVLCDIVKNSGCSNVFTINIDALKLSSNNNESDCNMSWCDDVEYILVDPSCSGSGIVERLNIYENEKYDIKRLKKLCGFQYKLLLHALTNFPKAKRVVYSTCSVLPEENEQVVQDVIEKLNEIYTSEDHKKKLKKCIPRFKLSEPLKDVWPSRGSDDFQYGNNCIFADPTYDLTNGFFVAVFEREPL